MSRREVQTHGAAPDPQAAAVLVNPGERDKVIRVNGQDLHFPGLKGEPDANGVIAAGWRATQRARDNGFKARRGVSPSRDIKLGTVDLRNPQAAAELSRLCQELEDAMDRSMAKPVAPRSVPIATEPEPKPERMNGDAVELYRPLPAIVLEAVAAIADAEDCDRLKVFQDEAIRLVPAIDGNEVSFQAAWEALVQTAEETGLAARCGMDGIRHVLHMALKNEQPAIPDRPPGAARDERNPPAIEPPAVLARALQFRRASALDGVSIPEQRWLVHDRVPMDAVTLLYGDGGTGKTTIALQLCASTVLGTDWLGAVIDERGPAMFFTGEETGDRVSKQLADIVAHCSITWRDLDDLHFHCVPDQEDLQQNATLFVPDRSGVITPTPLFAAFIASAAAVRPKLIVVETAADIFAGNENDRSQVRAAIAYLRRLALKAHAAVLMLCHPSQQGLNTGSGTSGSTGWNNSARARMYFTGPKAADSDEIEGTVRDLEVKKQNYGRSGEVVRVRWQRGVFVPVGSVASLDRAADEAAAENLFLELLAKLAGQGRYVGTSRSANFAPTVFAKMPEAKATNVKAAALEAAMERLFAAERITMQPKPNVPPSKATAVITRKNPAN